MRERKIMSSDAFMLPTLPQIPASGLNATGTKSPTAFKSNQLGESSDSSQSFSATLNRISDRRYGSKPKATSSQKPEVTSPGSRTESPSARKMSKTTKSQPDPIEATGASGSKESAPSIYPLSDFALMPSHLINLSIAEDVDLAVESPSGSTMKSVSLMLSDFIGHLHPQGQPVEGGLLGIGPFEQMQATISPEVNNWAFFEQLAGRAIHYQGNGELLGNPTQVFEFWQWMFSSASTNLDGTLNAQLESSGINENPSSSLNSLLQMLGMGTTGSAWGINPDVSGLHGPKMAAGQEGAHLNGTLLDRLTTLSELAQTGISDNAKMAAAGHSNSETLLDTQVRQMSENSQPLKIQEALKAAAEQPANPNSATAGITVKTPEEVFGIKSAVQKGEMLVGDTLGNKINQIDGDSKDSGFLFSQDQMPQHLARLENSAPSSEATQRSLMSPTLNQIVQKAVLSLHNGQHEVHLHLKPDFLGSIRMQIVSEGQQVAIKMVAEFPFVKDMLENNLHQLKAELQAQGLDIDELEVSVAHDSPAERDLHQNAEAAKLRAVKNGTDSDDGSSGKPGQTQSREGGLITETAIDYFA
jgi:hypothetical protein